MCQAPETAILKPLSDLALAREGVSLAEAKLQEAWELEVVARNRRVEAERNLELARQRHFEAFNKFADTGKAP